MKERIKIKLKETERGISNRDTSFKKFVLKNNLIKRQRNKFLNKVYTNNEQKMNQNEVNYAEDTITNSIKNTTIITRDLIENIDNSSKNEGSIPCKIIKHNKSNSIQKDEPEILNFQKIKLRQNLQLQRIYEKKKFVKSKKYDIKSHRQRVKAQEEPIKSFAFAPFHKQESQKKQVENQTRQYHIKQRETIRYDVKQKPKSYIKNRYKQREYIKNKTIYTDIKIKKQKQYAQSTFKRKASRPIKQEIAKSVATHTTNGIMTAICGIGGALVLIIVIIISLISSIFKTSVGFLFSDDSVDSINGDISIGNAMEVLEQELNEKVEKIKDDIDYDKLLIYGMTPNWREILSIYAVIGSNREGIDITSMKEENLDLLRKIFWEVCEIDWETSTYTVKHVYTKDGERCEEYIDKTKLEITLDKMDLDEMVGHYSFSNKEHEQLMELFKPEYQEMWAKLLAVG